MPEFDRARARLIAAREEIATCKISGAVGTYAHIDPVVEAHVAERMGLVAETHSTQVIPRDRHAMYFATLGVVASSIERLQPKSATCSALKSVKLRNSSPAARKGLRPCRTSATRC